MYKVYIDCGHGGTDPGACYGSLEESNLVLSVGLKLRDNLLKNSNFEVRMNRTYDKTMSLSSRVKDANSWGANIYISIHINSSTISSARGIETYCYNFNVRDLADDIHSCLLEDKSLYENDRGVKPANFYVLRETNMRACLLELGFISNAEDRVLVQNKQDAFALQITKGVYKHFNLEYKEDGYSVGSYQKDVKINTAALNVRSGRGTEYPVIGVVYRNQVHNIWYIDKASNGKLWGSLGLDGETGYISMEYTEPC